MEKKGAQFDHLLGVIIRSSLDVSAHDGLARTICERIKDAVQRYKLSTSDINDVIEALAKACPVAVLDVLVEKGNDEEETGRNVFREVRENRGYALQTIPDEALIDWANMKPQARYVALAQVVKYSDTNDDDNAACWSSIAERLIDVAPDALAVLNIFRGRFAPMGWSGSRAEIMATRIQLLQSLLRKGRPEVVDWAEATIPMFASEVDRERVYEATQDRNRDERFE